MSNDEFESHGQDASPNSLHKPEVIDAEVVDGVQRGQPILAWAVIVTIIALTIILPHLPLRRETPPPSGDFTNRMFQTIGKMFVAAAELPSEDRAQLVEAAQMLNQGPLQNRLMFIAVVGELAGPQEALDRLDDLDARLKLSTVKHEPDDMKVAKLLRRVYNDYENEQWNAPSLSAAERGVLKAKLEWFGALALAPVIEDQESSERERLMPPARRVLGVFSVFSLALLVIGVSGLVGFIVFIILSAMRKLRSRVQTGTGNGAIYAETFAVWLILFLTLSVGAMFVWRGTSLLPGGIVLAISLLAVVWPTRRGVPWRQVRADIGLKGGTGLMELIWGFVCYVSALPLLVLGVLLMFVFMQLAASMSGAPPLDEFAQTQGPSHPIIHWLSTGGALTWILAFAIACIVAPVVEEAMFRGVLYRHLREATAKWRIGVSVIVSASINSLIFAAIHPQGWVAIPPLAALALSFSLVREWRASLVAPMTMHAVNNGIMLGIVFLLTTS